MKNLTCILLMAASINFNTSTLVVAQGLVSAPSELGELESGDLAAMTRASPMQISTVQRLLRRLGFLNADQMTRQFDADTASALSQHFVAQGQSPRGLNAEQVMRSLFTTAWIKEDWSSGNVGGQSLVTDRAEIKVVQNQLKQLDYAPGPADGVFGPATLAAIEAFQEDNGMNISGLLSRNMQLNILLAARPEVKSARGEVRMLNWTDYVSPDVLVKFQTETGYRVIHEVFASSTETKTLLHQGSNRYDVMIQAGAQLRQVLSQPDAVEQFDRTKLPNIGGLDPATLKFTDVLDPGNTHSAPYMWGTVGLGINKEKVREMKPDAPLDSLSLIMDPAIAAEVSKCGIAIVDEPNDALPALAAWLGFDMTNLGITDIETLDQAIGKIAPFVTVVGTDSFIDVLAKGQYCVGWGYSGDIAVARGKAKENGTGAIVYSVPKEGSHLWFDMLVIPTKAQNKDGAYKLVDYLMRPDVAGANTNYIQYANPVTASAQYIDAALLADPGLFPPKSVWKRLAILPPLPADTEAELTRIWSKLKKG
jgi:putrescine transport system substrate-binding protein